MQCAFCKGNVKTAGKVSRTETCPHCGRDLKCCKQCKFYDLHAYNDCREVSAERIVEKERSNFCDYFVPRGARRGNVDPAADAKRALEALFKKK